MSDRPVELLWADFLQNELPEAAACLRRQHAEIESAHQAQREAENELSRALARHAMAESALKAECDALRTDYGKACGLVADMHAAATGRPGEGPRLGVVEDVAAVRAERDALRAQNEHWRVTTREHVSRSLYEAHTAELRAERDALRETEQKFGTMIHTMVAERDALRADAERWDYVRRNPWRAIDILKDKCSTRPACWREEADAAIDAAKEAGK